MTSLFRILFYSFLVFFHFSGWTQTYTFTNAGATGQDGPHQGQIDAAYASTPLEGQVQIRNNGIQEWTVPVTGTYRIEAKGASGGDTPYSPGGTGASLWRKIELTQGQVLQVVVGQKGEGTGPTGNGISGASGGGGSFVYSGSIGGSGLVIAAGGGGGGAPKVHPSGPGNRPDASFNSDGHYSTAEGFIAEGGRNGHGGGFANGGVSGGPGSGWLSDADNLFSHGFDYLGGRRFSGGTPNDGGAPGGFGGGGASGSNLEDPENLIVSGGGGGYSGGAAGTIASYAGGPGGTGGGGGSYLVGEDTAVLGSNTGHGKVVFVLPAPVEVTGIPESAVCPGTWVTLTASAVNGGNISWDKGVLNGQAFRLDETTTFTASSDHPDDLEVTFTITVDEDTDAPGFTGAERISYETKKGHCSAVVNYVPEFTDACAPATNLLENGDFEAGNSIGWSIASRGVAVNDGNLRVPTTGETLAPISGSYDLINIQPTRFSGYVASPPIKLPVELNSAVLRWKDRIWNLHSDYVEGRQELKVDLLDSNRDFLREIFVTRPGDPTIQEGPNARQFDLTEVLKPLAGQTVYLRFTQNAIDNTLQFSLDDVRLETSMTELTQTGGLPGGSEFPLGVTTNTYQAEDPSGNISTFTTAVEVEDKEAPTVITQDITIELDENGKAFITPEEIDNGSTDNCGLASMELDVTEFTCDDLGDKEVELTVTDEAGNSKTATATVMVKDNRAPTVKTKDFTVKLDAHGKASISAADIDNGSTDNCEIASMELDVTGFTCEDLGGHEVILTVTDKAGNSASKTAMVAVWDRVAPVIKVQDITVELDKTGRAFFTPDDIDNGTFDTCGDFSLILSTTQFGPEYLGANDVVLIAMDRYRNAARDTATVTVVDKLPPSAQAKDLRLQLDETGTASITVEDVDMGSTDNAKVASMKLDVTEFSCDDLGEKEVVLTVTDSSGNMDTDTASITVEDKMAPKAIAQDIHVQLQENGTASITPEDIDNGSTDNCGIAALDLDQTVFSCDNIGPNEVVLSVTDSSGNRSSARATVTVVDVMKPVLQTRDITLPLDANGTASLAAEEVVVSAEDNCGVESLRLSRTSFDCTAGAQAEVVVTLTDIHGNSTSATVLVTLKDALAPIVVAKDLVVELDETGTARISPEDVHEESLDNCGVASMSLDVDSFGCGETGMNVVLLHVTDFSGNTGTAEAIVEVLNSFGDHDADGLPDNCDDDDDNDGVPDTEDNSPWHHNPDQTDTDGDGEGDVSDPDDDGDGVEDAQDNCPLAYNPGQEDINNDGIGDVCDPKVLPAEGMTPNNDGINDTWRIVSLENHPNAAVTVYNRWGKVVFKAAPYKNDWEGSYEGNTLPDGSYYYQIDLDGDGGVDQDGWLYITK